MPAFSKTLAVPILIAGASTVLGQATQQQLAVVKAEYDASKFNAAYPDGFDVEAAPEALLNVRYGNNVLQLGQAEQQSAVGQLPGFTLTIPAGGNLSTSDKYTLMLADANPLGNAPAQAQGQYRHYLANGVSVAAGSDANTLNVNTQGATVVTPYAGPGPAAGEGPHRYAWMMFQQPSSFHAPANLSNAGAGPGHWYVGPYVQSSGLGPLVATSFFTVEQGTASYQVVATSSVDTATVAAASASGASGASSGGASATGAASSSAASPSSSGSSGASTVVVAAPAGFAAAVLAGLAALMA